MADGFNFQPYIQPYVAPPIQEFNRMGEVLNERYETNVANMTELELLASQIQVLPTSQAIKDKMLEEVNLTLSEIRERGDIENATPRVREAVRRFALDPNLRQAAENFQRASQYDEELRQARLEGRDMIQFLDYRNEQFVDGRLQPLMSDNQQRLDYRSRYETYFDNLQPESISISESGWGQGPGGIYQQTGVATEKAGIAADTIRDIVDSNLDGVITSTNEGVQRFRELTELQGLSADEARETIRGEMMGAGLERVFQRTSTSTSASPLEPVGLAREKMLLDMQQTKMKIAKEAMAGQRTGGSSYIIKGNDLSDAAIGAEVPKSEWFTNKGINSLLDFAFSGEPEDRVRGRFEFQNVLDNLMSSNNQEVRETAESYRSLINKAEELLGDNADQFIHAALKGGNTAQRTGALIDSGLSPEQQAELSREFRLLRQNSKGLIWDTKFENEIESSLKSPVTRNIAWLGPKYIGDEAFDSSLRTAWGAATSKEEWDLSNFEIVRGDPKAAGNLTDTRVEIVNVSNDVIGGGHGIGYLIRDSSGAMHVAVPKTTGYEQHLESQFLPQVANVLGAQDLVYKNQFKHNVVPGQSKSLQEIAQQNNISVFEDVSNMRIKGTDLGYQLYNGNNPYTFSEYYKDFESSRMTPEGTNKIVNDARRAGVISDSDIREVMLPNGDVDVRRLLPKIQNSKKPVLFDSQYDIYNAYLR